MSLMTKTTAHLNKTVGKEGPGSISPYCKSCAFEHLLLFDFVKRYVTQPD